jgi:DNA-directed RNA polymerase subunit N (RpoN/RPB10)
VVFTVRCYKCGQEAVRLVLGGRAILHARCHSCNANLLAEVLEFEENSRRAPNLQREQSTQELVDLETTEAIQSGAE